MPDSTPTVPPTDMTVGGYLLHRLKELGADHIFGVPGDFVLGFLNQVLTSEVTYVGACGELGAAYAADGYARIRGLGAVVTTFGVGELSAVNGIAGAFAERIPVVMIAGSPSTQAFATQPLLHHTLGDYGIPQQIFEKITVAAAQITDGSTAPAAIDAVLLACLREQRPVYLSLPADVVRMPCASPQPFAFPTPVPSQFEALRAALLDAVTTLAAAKRPVIIAGVELIRGKLERQFAEFLQASGAPYVTMMMGKSVLNESHPQYAGLFQGDRSPEAVRRLLAEADCIVELGVWLTDFNTGGFTAHLDAGRTIRAGQRHVRVQERHYAEVELQDLLQAWTDQLRSAASPESPRPLPSRAPVAVPMPQPDAPLSVERFFARAGQFIADNSIVIAETGVSLFSAAELPMADGVTFIGQTFYGSIGYALGAALGAAVAAPDRRVVLFVGDGAFQVTCQELSTLIRQHTRPIIFLLNNDGYTIERVICDRSYNDLQPWKYHALVDAFGGGLALVVRTEGELESALEQAADAPGLVFVEVVTPRIDCSPALRSAGKSMATTNHLT